MATARCSSHARRVLSPSRAGTCRIRRTVQQRRRRTGEDAEGPGVYAGFPGRKRGKGGQSGPPAEPRPSVRGLCSRAHCGGRARRPPGRPPTAAVPPLRLLPLAGVAPSASPHARPSSACRRQRSAFLRPGPLGFDFSAPSITPSFLAFGPSSHLEPSSQYVRRFEHVLSYFFFFF